jgi:hypothetical protein
MPSRTLWCDLAGLVASLGKVPESYLQRTLAGMIGCQDFTIPSHEAMQPST